uniref:RNase H type-1 domain-containing protein n=1 Tax=Setaria viridis TaxID=4556 RepID=A0A4U6VNL4_SETVI|nr:hypothetical protein SEVIR_3G161600v2 [Setaria viridis]
MFQEPPAGKREASHSKSTAQWKPPDPGWFKINVDGAFSERSGAGGVGVVIRDHLGAVKLAAWRVIFGASNAEEVEARACKEGADLAAEWIRAPVILESDRAMSCKANELAQMAKRLNHGAVWRDRFPVCIEHFIDQGCNPPMSN